jgi:hypothetical protein
MNTDIAEDRDVNTCYNRVKENIDISTHEVGSVSLQLVPIVLIN